jgi:hypothetical protein
MARKTDLANQIGKQLIAVRAQQPLVRDFTNSVLMRRPAYGDKEQWL